MSVKKPRRRRRTKAEMAMVRAKESAKARVAGQAATCNTSEVVPRSSASKEDQDFEESKNRNQAGQAARIPAFDRFLLSDLDRIGGVWKIASKQEDGMWAVIDQNGKKIAKAHSKEIAEAIAVIPLVICTYALSANVFAMTDKERDFYSTACQGLFEARLFLEK